MYRPLALALLVAPLGAAAQINHEEGSDSAQLCPGETRSIPLAPSDFIDLGGSVQSIAFGPGPRVCFSDTDVLILAEPPESFACTTIRDSGDEGLGYSFSAEGIPHHLWLYIDPAADAPSLEIGLYREDEELVWIDTGTTICAR